MRLLTKLPVLGLCASTVLYAQPPEWAYQSVSEEIPAAHRYDENEQRTVPGSSFTRTQPEINDHWNPPDWFPDQHTPLPEVVAQGAGPHVRACMTCHLSSGIGKPESSHLAGLPVPYIIRQMADYKSGARKDRYWMNPIAVAISEEDVLAAAEYYAAIEPVSGVVDVIEADTVPRTYVGEGRLRFVHPDGGTEALGYKVMEIPEDRDLVTARHPNGVFIAYVPVGSIARGEVLATTGGSGKTIVCTACHGQDLKGLGEVPRIAGLSPLYAIRQLNDFKTGDRSGSMAMLMDPTVANLTTEDMVDLVAYMATLDPKPGRDGNENDKNSD